MRLTWFDQTCLHPLMREDHSTVQQRTLQRIEPKHYKGHNQIQLLGSRNIPCFPTLRIPTLLQALSLHRVPPVLPHISIHLIQSSKAHIYLITFFLHDQNIYGDISNNLLYSRRKSNIIIIYQPRNILYNILYKKKKNLY